MAKYILIKRKEAIMSKVAVLIRHLPGHRPVTMAVIPEPKVAVEDLDDYFKVIGDRLTREMKVRCLEFETASFYLDVLTQHIEKDVS
jgi:hypothetical protein